MASTKRVIDHHLKFFGVGEPFALVELAASVRAYLDRKCFTLNFQEQGVV